MRLRDKEGRTYEFRRLRRQFRAWHDDGGAWRSRYVSEEKWA